MSGLTNVEIWHELDAIEALEGVLYPKQKQIMDKIKALANQTKELEDQLDALCINELSTRKHRCIGELQKRDNFSYKHWYSAIHLEVSSDIDIVFPGKAAMRFTSGKEAAEYIRANHLNAEHAVFRTIDQQVMEKFK